MFEKIRADYRAGRATSDERVQAIIARGEAAKTAREQAKAERVASAQAARAEHARIIAAHDDGLVASFDRFRLYPDRIVVVESRRRKDQGLKPDSRPLAGVRARVSEDRNGLEMGGWDQRDVYLTISGPGFEWAVRTDAIWSSRKARDFAALVNGAGSAAGPAGGQGPAADVAGQLARLAELHRTGALTGDEYSAAKARALT